MKQGNFLKLMGTLGLMLIPFLQVSSAPLTPSQALQRVNTQTSGLRMSRGSAYRLTYTESIHGNAAIYVFNQAESGFLVTSADDRLPAVLGYSDSGAFDISKASPELKWWLSQYAAEADYYFKNEGDFAYSATPKAVSRADIPEMLKTRWNQDFPYNLDCPSDAGGRSVTGCVATAMAQVVKYHEWPATGSGSHSYSWNNTTLSYNYAASTFDFANMLDEYDGNETETQNYAVANLMYACGVGVNMDYSSYESGAGDIYIPYALKTYFNYDGGVRLLKRIYYSTEEWEELVYSELKDGRPVIYGGQAPTGGHEFVCDGYENGLFHINWGWAGMGNGYFRLSALDPGLQGIGGFDGGYNSDQAIVCGIKPATTSSTEWYPIYATGGLNVNQVSGDIVIIGMDSGKGIFNYSPEAVTVSFYLKAVSQTTGKEYISEKSYQDMDFGGAQGLSVSGYRSVIVYLPADMPAGEYTASLVFETPDGNMQELLIPRSAVGYLNMTVDSSGNVSFTSGAPAEKAKVWVSKFAPVGNVNPNATVQFDIIAENRSEIEYSNAIYVRAFLPGTDSSPLWNTGINLSLAAGGNISGHVNLTVPLEEGMYDLICYDVYGDKISDVIPLKVGNPNVPVTGITLDKSEETIGVGESLTLKATVTPEAATDKTITWSSSNEEVATVKNGVVTAISAGKATITATCGSFSASCEITVINKVIPANGIALNKNEETLIEGESLTLTATVSPENATDKTVVWSSSNEEVATVKDGVVTAISAGKATITATCGSVSATCEITVTAKVIPASGIELDKNEETLIEGESLTLTATVSPENATDKTVVWSSSNEEVATVKDGVVTAISAGKATITATCGSVSATCEITVTAKVIPASGIVLDKNEETLIEGESLTLTATVSPENATDKTVVWSSSNEEVATVKDGVVTAISAGKATITATCGSVSATCEITVTAKVIPASGIALDKNEETLFEGESLTLTATVSPENATDKSVVWSSSNEEVATVKDGVVTAISAGKATITATCGSVSATCEITVTAKVIPASGIALNKNEETLIEGESLTLTATVSPENATDKSVVWSSSNEEVASVKDGVVTAISAGKATITATCGSVSATCEITVTAKVIPASGIALDKNEETLFEGESLTLTATVSPENATDKTVVWSSSDVEVATVKDGVVTAISAGKATITATCGSVSATCEIEVLKKDVTILATSITLDHTSFESIPGSTFTLVATVLPEDATNKEVEWSSSDTGVATVDKDGLVTIVSVGTAIITASTVDGSNLSANCSVFGLSGIEALIMDAGKADIYTVNGYLVKKNADTSFISTLQKGIYIIRIDNKTYKVLR